MQLASVHQPSLNRVFQELCDDPETAHKPPKGVSAFLKALACPTAVCALVSQSEVLLRTILAIADGKTTHRVPETFKVLQTEAPIIAKLLTALPDGAPSFSPVLRELVNLAGVPFLGQQHDLPTAAQAEPHSYFPSLDKKCERGAYQMDKTKKDGPKDCNDRKSWKCQKKEKGHPTLTPGIFTLFCPHGRCNYVLSCDVLPRRRHARHPTHYEQPSVSMDTQRNNLKPFKRKQCPKQL